MFKVLVTTFMFLMFTLTPVSSNAQQAQCGKTKDVREALADAGEAVVVQMLTHNNILVGIWRDDARQNWTITVTYPKAEQTCLYLHGLGFVNTIWHLKQDNKKL